MDIKGDGPYTHGQSGGNGNGLPAERAKDWQFREGVLGGRVTIYDFP